MVRQNRFLIKDFYIEKDELDDFILLTCIINVYFVA